MNSQQHKEKFGVSKTRYKNMKKKGLEINTEGISSYKKLVKEANKEKIKTRQEKRKKASALRGQKSSTKKK